MRLQQEDIYRKVCVCLERDKVYLDAHLSLVRLAVIVGTNTTYLSNAINKCAGCNFCTFVNDYRIRHAVNLIQGQNEIHSIAGLHRRCGFHSVSVFYDAFKRRTGFSPLQMVHRIREERIKSEAQAAKPVLEDSLRCSVLA